MKEKHTIRRECDTEGCKSQQRKKHKRLDGTQCYSKYCSRCERIMYSGEVLKGVYRSESGEAKFDYRSVKSDTCTKCGWVADDKCQLDVDHIDGDHSNNSLDNLQTLCANCHRLKTKINREGWYGR